MTVHDKTRLLALGLPPNGLVFKEDAGNRYLPLSNVPFELDMIVARWLLALPPTAQEAVSYGFGDDFKGLTPEGWAAFVAWLKVALDAAQRQDDFLADVAVTAQRHFDL